ncbi:MAG: alpha/beta hydrolase [Oleiphilaceae bacterium]|nr:alpha/beta hydrolase [Oleiphilaceae bacterium]
MKKLRTFLGLSIVVIAAVLATTYWLHDIESQTLNNATRDALGVQYATLEHGATAYQIANQTAEKTIVFVHGFSVPSYVWDPTFDYFAQQGYRTLRFDLYGRGFSDRPELDYQIDFFVSQLDQLLTYLKIEQPIHLVGLSMGGPVVTRFTHRFYERVASLSLLAPLVHTPEDPAIKLLATPLLGDYLATTLMMPRILNSLSTSVYNPASFPDWHEKMARHSHYKGYRRALLSTLQTLNGRNFMEDYQALGQTTVPVQLAWGKNDQVLPFAEHKKVLEAVERVEFLALDQCGHLPQLEHPDIINRWLRDFTQNRP